MNAPGTAPTVASEPPPDPNSGTKCDQLPLPMATPRIMKPAKDAIFTTVMIPWNRVPSFTPK